MGILARIADRYGDIPQCGGQGPDPQRIEVEGTGFLKAEFPNLSWVRSAVLKP